MSVYTYRSGFILFILFMFSPTLESSQCGRSQLRNLSCTEARACSDSPTCNSYDPEYVNIVLQALTPESDFDGIMTSLKCEVYKSKEVLCNLSDDIRRMVRTNCRNRM